MLPVDNLFCFKDLFCVSKLTPLFNIRPFFFSEHSNAAINVNTTDVRNFNASKVD